MQHSNDEEVVMNGRYITYPPALVSRWIFASNVAAAEKKKINISYHMFTISNERETCAVKFYFSLWNEFFFPQKKIKFIHYTKWMRCRTEKKRSNIIRNTQEVRPFENKQTFSLSALWTVVSMRAHKNWSLSLGTCDFISFRKKWYGNRGSRVYKETIDYARLVCELSSIVG